MQMHSSHGKHAGSWLLQCATTYMLRDHARLLNLVTDRADAAKRAERNL